MKKTVAYATLGSFGLICGLSTAIAEVITWDSIPNLARQRNGRISAQVERVQAAESLIGHTLRSFHPVLGISGGLEYAKQGNRSEYTQPYYGIEGRINIYSFGRDSLQERVAEARLLASRANSTMTESEVIFEIRKYYLDWLLADQLAREYQDALIENQKGLKSAIRRISRGVGTATDRTEFTLNEKDLEQEIESFEHEKKIITTLISGLLRLENSDNLLIQGKLHHAHDEQLQGDLRSFAKDAPISRLIDANHQESLAASAKLVRWWAPDVDLFGGQYLYTFRNREEWRAFDRSESTLGLELRFTLWNAQENAQSRASKRLEYAIHSETSQSSAEVNSRMIALQEEMKHAHEILHRIEQKNDLVNSYLQQSLSEYDRGIKQSPDVIVAFQRKLRLKEELNRSMYNHQLARAKLLRELGR